MNDEGIEGVEQPLALSGSAIQERRILRTNNNKQYEVRLGLFPLDIQNTFYYYNLERTGWIVEMED